MYRLLAAAIGGVTILAGPALADPTVSDILPTLDQFMIANSVATRCGKADEAKAAAFNHNFQIVSAQAQAALKTLSSDLTQARIDKVIADHYGEIDRRVAAIVAQETCDGSHIKEALQKYDSDAGVLMTHILATKGD